MNVERLKENLPDVWEQLSIEAYDELASTNDWVKERLKENPQNELLVLAKRQTNGRGRSNRSFYSTLSHGLYFTLGIHPINVSPNNLPLYTIAAATALIQAVEIELGIELKVKWVNDLFYQGKKVAGILTETLTDPKTNKVSSIVLGIGVNLAGSFADADVGTQAVAGTLYEELPADFNLEKLLQQFLHQFGRYHQHLSMKQFLPIYEKKLLGIHEEVRYERKKKAYYGIIKGINSQGQLLVENKQGELLTLVGEEIHFSSNAFRRYLGG